MADQKELKKRLKVLMTLPENQVCSDCPERQPRWASLIVPPPGAPEGSLPIGAFCCLECSGSHRRLGVHISFVRSINLDSWKEKEVLAMENGGNAKVNAIFEARLAMSGAQKPTTHADGPTRERFIRDKYERRKYYDASAFERLQVEKARTEAQFEQLASQRAAANAVGPPSDAARQRIEERRSKLNQEVRAQSDFDDAFGNREGQSARTPKRTTSNLSSSSNRIRRTKSKDKDILKEKERPASAPVSAPVMFDLLDLTSDPAPSHALKSNLNYVVATAKSDDGIVSNNRGSSQANGLAAKDIFDVMASDHNENTKDQMPATRVREPSMTADILSLYTNPTTQQHQQQLYGFNNQGTTGGNMMMNMNQGGDNSQAMANLTAMMQNTGMNFMVQPNAMLQQQLMYQQQLMMQLKQQEQQHSNHMMNFNMGLNNSGLNNSNFGMMGSNPQQQQQQQQANFGFPQQNMMMMQNQQGGMMNTGGFGAPMGSGPPMSTMQQPSAMNNSGRRGSSGNGSSGANNQTSAEINDPFAQFGKNVFRS